MTETVGLQMDAKRLAEAQMRCEVTTWHSGTAAFALLGYLEDALHDLAIWKERCAALEMELAQLRDQERAQ